MGCITITEYEPLDGSLMGVWTVEEETLDKIGIHYYVEGEHDSKNFFVEIDTEAHEVKPRPKQATKQNKTEIKADGIELVKFSKLPQPCKVHVNSEKYQVEDGVFEWGTRLPGVYVVRVVAFPFLDWEGTVTAV